MQANNAQLTLLTLKKFRESKGGKGSKEVVKKKK